jgi:hypothetical protein
MKDHIPRDVFGEAEFKAQARGLAALFLGIIFFSLGNFGFWNIFGIRRLMQLVLLTIWAALSLVTLRRSSSFLREPLFLYVAASILFELFLRGRSSDLLDGILSLAILASIYNMRRDEARKVMKPLIIIAAIFAIIGIIQFFILWFNQDYIWTFDSFYTSKTGSAPVHLTHWIQYLGFTEPATGAQIMVMGVRFTRLHSYASEPSVLVYSLLAPALIALAFGKRYRWCAIPLLIFVLFLVQSGTIYLSIVFGILSWVLLRLARRWNVRIIALLPFLIVAVSMIFLMRSDIAGLMAKLQNLLMPLFKFSSKLDPLRSGVDRFSSVTGMFDTIKYNIFGSSLNIKDVGQMGLLLYSYYYAGIVGLSLMAAFLYRTFKNILGFFRRSKGLERLGAALVFGLLIQVMLFSSYGWTATSGFIMLAFLQICFLPQRSLRPDKNIPPPVIRPVSIPLQDR